ncbi:2-dehydropantoate 2-reductase [Bosea caraganae]|uniref:2-dehydropantoate 2-reductase n=1 Tax=Bosea caraganae TaxID=2763117 RepID=A0A370L619_9HYPH|nr:2-dehydropantoate 2-reductase [Bosea caraganae]RDJ23176.1 2-dehydropantoate 2-reductase [Bosea caraganae]RDJ24711.1 2-dehydropantoate 2-reductase [Bosea caraganae]
MRLLVVGAGSTGGYFGGRLAAAGRDVTFLVRARRAAQLKAEGLQIVSPHGDLTLQPKIVTAESIDGTYDAILLSVKAFSLAAALDDLAPAVGADTVIVPVLNGMKHVDLLQARFGKQAIAGGVCKIAATIDAQDRVVQLAPFHDLAYGELSGASSERMAALDVFMQGAGFDARLSPTIQREMWEKWIFLSSLGAITCLMRGTIGETEAAPGGLAFANALFEEVVAIVRAVGTPPGEGFLTTIRGQLTAKGSPLTSSMYRDLQKGGAIEAEQIIGDLLARGERAGIAAPLLNATYANLSIYQGRVGTA